MYRSKLIKLLLMFVSFFASGKSFSQAQPVYTPPANRVGGAIASGITQTLVRRGFAANDPRVVQTIQSIGARVVPLATAAGAGANWIGIASRLSPWLLLGVTVYQGIKWYYDANGNVVTKTSSGVPSSGGVQVGQPCYYVTGGGACASTPEEAVLEFVLRTTVYVDLTSIVLTPDAANSPAYANGRRYTAAISGHRNGDPNTIWPNASPYYVYLGTASISCPIGQGELVGSCVPTRLDRYNPTTQSSGSQTQQAAYNALPQAAKDYALNREVAAEYANRLWRDAATQPDYRGVPWNASDPVTAPDFAPHQTEHPADWPLTSEINQTVPTTGPSPITSPETNPNQVNPPSTATTINLGPDPGIAAPTLEQTPDNIFKPIADLMQPWLSWQVPAHSTQCPTWQAAPSISGRTFAINISSHCTFVDQYRSLILAAAVACWIVIATFIVLSA
jgi:hypothetical protein